MKTGPVAVTCATLLVAGFAFWPTIYRYDRLGGRGGMSVPIRINRLTGRAEQYPWDEVAPITTEARTPWTKEASPTPDRTSSGDEVRAPGAIRGPLSDILKDIKLKMPYAERAKITGNAGFNPLFSGVFSGKIYNGSGWTVERVIFRIVVREPGGTVRWDRKFDEEISARPMTTVQFSVSVTGEENTGSFEWYVEDAFGRMP